MVTQMGKCVSIYGGVERAHTRNKNTGTCTNASEVRTSSWLHIEDKTTAGLVLCSRTCPAVAAQSQAYQSVLAVQQVTHTAQVLAVHKVWVVRWKT